MRDDTAPRIPVLLDPSSEQAEILGKTALSDGTIPNVFLTMAHNTQLLKRVNVLGGYFSRFALLPARTVKLIILRTAHRAGSLYEFAIHRQLALEAGLLADKEVEGIVTDTFDWAEEDRLGIRVVDELFEQHSLSDSTWAELVEAFPADIVIEMLMLVGFYRGLAGFLNSARIPLDDHIRDRDWPRSRVEGRPLR